MGLMVRKNFHIGYDIKSYARVSKLEFSIKNNKWTCIIDFYFDKTSVDRKKINSWIREWVLENQEKITEELWEFIDNTYLDQDSDLIPIGTEVLELDNILSPWDFENEEGIFNWIYGQIKVNPVLINASEILDDILEDKDELMKPIMKKIEKFLKNDTHKTE